MQNLFDNDYEFEESEIELLLGDIGDACVLEDSTLFEEFLDDIRAGNAADFFVGAEPAIGSAPATAAAASRWKLTHQPQLQQPQLVRRKSTLELAQARLLGELADFEH